MAGASTYLENKILDHVLRNTAYTSPAAVYVGLYSVAPTDAGGGTEFSGTGYIRKAATFSAASGGSTANSADVNYGTVGAGGWGTPVAFGVFDAESAGNLLIWNDLSPSLQVPHNAGDTVKFTAGDLSVTAD